MRTLLTLALVAALAFAAGRWSAPDAGHEINAMLAVGFTLTDPEGFEIERFDE